MHSKLIIFSWTLCKNLINSYSSQRDNLPPTPQTRTKSTCRAHTPTCNKRTLLIREKSNKYM